MSNEAVKFGYLGKIPSRGDFVKAHISTEIEKTWNDWLQAAIAVSQDQLGSKWQDVYLTSPVWHFAISESVVGDRPLFGSIIPSIDSVGRHYPFTVLNQEKCDPITVFDNRKTDFSYEDKILEALNEELDIDCWLNQVNESVDIIKKPQKAIKTVPNGEPTKPSLVLNLSGDEHSLDDKNLLLHALLKQHYGAYSLWWTHGSCNLKPSTIVVSGLPPVSQVAAMLDGRWREREWNIAQERNHHD